MPHALTSNLLHCVFSTKGRVGSIPEPDALGRYLAGVGREKNIPLIITGGTNNHVHLLIALPAATPLAKAVQELKGNSSRWLNQKRSGFAWQEGYGAFSVRLSNKQAVMDYIAEQPRHHAKRTFEQEFETMLRKSGVDYDPRYIFG
ncbi:MAG: transposase [Candidatus Korobacteraceae bacterium]